MTDWRIIRDLLLGRIRINQEADLSMIAIDNMADLPEGCMVVEAYAVIKVLDPDGGVGFYTRQTKDLSDWEALGMLMAATDKLRQQLSDNWEPDT